jgi:hypothetical protein
MNEAMSSNDLQLNLFFATAAVPIPRDHPAFTGSPPPSRAARRWSVAATLAGSLLVAAVASGIAHYILETAAPASEDAIAPAAVAAAIPAAQPVTPAAAAPGASQALPPTASETAEPASLEAAPSVAAAPSAVTVPPVAAKRHFRAGTNPTRSASLARKNIGRSAREHTEVAALPSSPSADAMLIAAGPSVEPVAATLGADNTNRR